MTLDECGIGDSGRIVAVGGDGALRCRLLDMGLTPNTRVTLQKIAPMGDPMEIQVRGYELTIRKEDARKIEITPLETHKKEDMTEKRHLHIITRTREKKG